MTFFQTLIPNRKRREGSSIICHVPKSFPTPGTPPGHLFLFQTQTLWLCFSSHVTKTALEVLLKYVNLSLRNRCCHALLEETVGIVAKRRWILILIVFNFCRTPYFSFHGIADIWEIAARIRCFGRLKNNSITRKCSQFRVNLLITFYRVHKIVVIPFRLNKLHYFGPA